MFAGRHLAGGGRHSGSPICTETEVDENLMLILKGSAEHYVQNAMRFKLGLKEEDR